MFHQLNNFGSVSGTPESHADVRLSLHVHASKIKLQAKRCRFRRGSDETKPPKATKPTTTTSRSS